MGGFRSNLPDYQINVNTLTQEASLVAASQIQIGDLLGITAAGNAFPYTSTASTMQAAGSTVLAATTGSTASGYTVVAPNGHNAFTWYSGAGAGQVHIRDALGNNLSTIVGTGNVVPYATFDGSFFLVDTSNSGTTDTAVVHVVTNNGVDIAQHTFTYSTNGSEAGRVSRNHFLYTATPTSGTTTVGCIGSDGSAYSAILSSPTNLPLMSLANGNFVLGGTIYNPTLSATVGTVSDPNGVYDNVSDFFFTLNGGASVISKVDAATGTSTALYTAKAGGSTGLVLLTAVSGLLFFKNEYGLISAMDGSGNVLYSASPNGTVTVGGLTDYVMGTYSILNSVSSGTSTVTTWDVRTGVKIATVSLSPTSTAYTAGNVSGGVIALQYGQYGELIKAIDTQMLGVAQDAAVGGDLVTINTSKGVFPVNSLGGGAVTFPTPASVIPIGATGSLIGSTLLTSGI